VELLLRQVLLPPLALVVPLLVMMMTVMEVAAVMASQMRIAMTMILVLAVVDWALRLGEATLISCRAQLTMRVVLRVGRGAKPMVPSLTMGTWVVIMEDTIVVRWTARRRTMESVREGAGLWMMMMTKSMIVQELMMQGVLLPVMAVVRAVEVREKETIRWRAGQGMVVMVTGRASAIVWVLLLLIVTMVTVTTAVATMVTVAIVVMEVVVPVAGAVTLGETTVLR
jgi:hypothetical protein